MALHGVLDDREPEACSARPSRARLIGAVEPLEDALLVALGDADPAVGDSDLDDAVRRFDADSHAEPRGEYTMALATRLPTASLRIWASPRTYEPALAAAHDGDPGRIGLDRVGLQRRGDDLVDRDLAVDRQLVGRLQPREVHDARRQPASRAASAESRAVKILTCAGSSAADSMASASRLTAPTAS